MTIWFLYSHQHTLQTHNQTFLEINWSSIQFLIWTKSGGKWASFSLIVSENGLEYIDKFWLFINYGPNGTKSIKQVPTLIGIMEFENIAIDNDFPANSLFPAVPAC